MANAVLERLREQRAEQIASMDAVLAQVEGRDLVDAERSLLEAARQRVAEIDAQIEPLAAFDALRQADAETRSGLPTAAPTLPAVPRRADAALRDFPYRDAGAYLADICRAAGCLPGGQFGDPDEQARARVAQARAVANQTTAETPGILPTPIVGGVVSLIDANRPLVSSLGGAKPLGGIPGTSFSRPKITTHTQVGPQAGEKTQLPSRAMVIDPIPFTKETHGGTVNISRQDIDWTSPSAWDILVRDLADVYAQESETAVATAFQTAATGTAVPVASPDIIGWAAALYTAAANSYAAGKRMPDRVWCSLDVWAALGALVDVARLVFPPGGADNDNAAGTADLGSFRGDVIGLPRIVVPTFPAGTCIVGPSTLYEAYEEVIGLLSVVEPSILGVEVAYGGYLAYGTLEPTAFVPLTAPAGMTRIDPVTADADAEAHDAEAHDAEAPHRARSGK
jgi:HK97 family phage major capsid protein